MQVLDCFVFKSCCCWRLQTFRIGVICTKNVMKLVYGDAQGLFYFFFFFLLHDVNECNFMVSYVI
jgi:hypothetical protein